MDLSSPSRAPCSINKLPFELLTAVASLLDHPVDILSLTRSSKRLFQSLTNQHALFVWKEARKAFQPESIPDPPKIFTEYGWIAFLFGPNNCARCQKRTFDLPWSLKLRAHMCKTCQKIRGMELVNSSFFVTEGGPVPREIDNKLRRMCHVYDSRGWICSFIPNLERNREELCRDDQLWWPLLEDFAEIHRKQDWDRILSHVISILNSEQPVNVEIRLKKLKKTMVNWYIKEQEANGLLYWLSKYENHLSYQEKTFLEHVESWCRKQKVTYEDLQNSKTYREIRGILKRQRSSIILPHLKENREKLLLETSVISSRRAERERTKTLQARREALKEFYDQQVTKMEYHPSFSAFRALPTVKSLTNSWSTSDISSQFESQTLQELLVTEVAQWLNRTTQKARQKLGYYDPSNKHGRGKKDTSLAWLPTENKLDPEKRVTSWFTCTKCNDVEPRYKRMMVLDFKGLCAHECKEKHKSARDRTSWDIDNFIVNTRAQEAARKMLNLVEIEEDCRTSWSVLKRKEEFTCKSCPSVMRYMSFPDMIRHSQRHETENIGYMPSDIRELKRIGTYRFSYAELASGKYPEEVNRKQFYCVHCTTRTTYPDLRDFNSLRSHIKSKHNILDIRSDDYKFVEDPSLHKNVSEALPEDISGEETTSTPPPLRTA
ncbi:hypothetical protein CPB86DRAFT_826475 [Serendipita vermifera]|nr:hypothetical protein CPB86DRAFT_826475 [Serendipita vermifera]